jgi:hypothetical protein
MKGGRKLTRGMTQVVGCLPSNLESVGSIPNTGKKKK